MRITIPLGLCLAGLLWQPIIGAQWQAGVAAQSGSGSGDEIDGGKQPPGDLGHLEDLNLLSEKLVTRASSGSAPAHEFRIESRMYRELLRKFMLDNRDRAESEQIPQPLLVDMVRMSALLHSAAECKTGRVIVCPADLMQQLRSQQTRVTQNLEMLRMMHR